MTFREIMHEVKFISGGQDGLAPSAVVIHGEAGKKKAYRLIDDRGKIVRKGDNLDSLADFALVFDENEIRCKGTYFDIYFLALLYSDRYIKITDLCGQSRRPDELQDLLALPFRVEPMSDGRLNLQAVDKLLPGSMVISAQQINF